MARGRTLAEDSPLGSALREEDKVASKRNRLRTVAVTGLAGVVATATISKAFLYDYLYGHDMLHGNSLLLAGGAAILAGGVFTFMTVYGSVGWNYGLPSKSDIGPLEREDL